MERRRRRLVRLITLAAVVSAGCIALAVYVQIFVFTLLLLLPVFYMAMALVFRVQVYFQEFKPRIVALILDFIDNNVNYSSLEYQPKGTISSDRFLSSMIFSNAEDFHGEDLITGKVRETPFELCELRVSEFSPVRNKLDRVFNGVLICGDYHNLDMTGALLVLPDENIKYLSRSERAFHLAGGRRVHGQALPEFETWFNTYATPDMRIHDVLSDDFQRTILAFRERNQLAGHAKEVYFSIIGDNIFIAVSQDKDMLEPSLFRSNVTFALIKEFHDDIAVLLDLILKIDALN